METQLTGALEQNLDYISVDSVVGFPAAGTLLIDGTYFMKYTSTSEGQFSGVDWSNVPQMMVWPDVITVKNAVMTYPGLYTSHSSNINISSVYDYVIVPINGLNVMLRPFIAAIEFTVHDNGGGGSVHLKHAMGKIRPSDNKPVTYSLIQMHSLSDIQTSSLSTAIAAKYNSYDLEIQPVIERTSLEPQQTVVCTLNSSKNMVDESMSRVVSVSDATRHIRYPRRAVYAGTSDSLHRAFLKKYRTTMDDTALWEWRMGGGNVENKGVHHIASRSWYMTDNGRYVTNKYARDNNIVFEDGNGVQANTTDSMHVLETCVPQFCRNNWENTHNKYNKKPGKY